MAKKSRAKRRRQARATARRREVGKLGEPTPAPSSVAVIGEEAEARSDPFGAGDEILERLDDALTSA